MQHRPFIIPTVGRIRYTAYTYPNGLRIKRRYRNGRLLSESYSMPKFYESDLYKSIIGE